METISNVTDIEITKLIYFFLRSTSSIFQGQSYETTSGVVRGYPSSPIIVTIFMEVFETKTTISYHFEPKVWNSFANDNTIIFSHCNSELEKFDHVNNQ